MTFRPPRSSLLSPALLAAMAFICTPAATHAEEDDVAAAIRASEKLDGDAQLLKRGRLTPSGKDGDVPVLNSPVGPDATTDGTEPSTGINVLDRMGTGLPDLPPEKPFTGKVDEAYGAFQRGYYLRAMELALPKAQLGNASAQVLVAEMLANGLGIRQNVKDATFWYEQAANAGDSNAQYKFALILMDGRLVARDKARADEMMRKAAEGGNKFAQFNIAQIMVAAAPGEKGLKDALPWYEKAALQGVPDAQYALSQLYLNLDLPKEKRAEARTWLAKAARAGFDTAQYDMAVWLINGISGERDLKAGFEWMRKAAIGGHVLAQNKLAHLYINAIGTGPDPVEATKWYVLSRRAGLKDLELEDFYLGISEEVQKAGIAAANRFSTGQRR